MEKEYIEYLIENVKEIDTSVLDSYFRSELDFYDLIKLIDVTSYDVLSYNSFVKSKKIDDLFS
jgi:hypothetical protein